VTRRPIKKTLPLLIILVSALLAISSNRVAFTLRLVNFPLFCDCGIKPAPSPRLLPAIFRDFPATLLYADENSRRDG